MLGGPHARCYPDDAQRYFDYVLGITDRALVEDVLNDCTQHRPLGVSLSANNQPLHLPGCPGTLEVCQRNTRQDTNPDQVRADDR